MNTSDLPAPRTLATGFVFCEAPRWHDDVLWFSDMHGEAIYQVDLAGTLTTVLSLPGVKPSGLGFLPGGDLLFVSMAERRIYRYDGHQVSLHADLAPVVSDDLNDMVVDHLGRAYVGSFPLVTDGGVLIQVDLNGQASIAASDLEFPNGTVISADGRTLIVTESKGRRYSVYDVAPSGELTNRRLHAAYSDGAGDGLALDADGALWSAVPLAHRFVRLLPGGEVTHVIEAGDRMPIACTLGGPDRKTLFLLTATDVYPERLAGIRESRIETLEVEVPGAGLP